MQVRVNTFGSSFLSLNIVIAEKYLKKKELFERAFKAHSAVIKSFSSISVWSKKLQIIIGLPWTHTASFFNFFQTNVREAPSKRRKIL